MARLGRGQPRGVWRSPEPNFGAYDLLVRSLNPSGWWRLNDGVGSGIANDQSGAGNVGTVHGTVTFGQGSALLSAPNETSALFDGSTGYISTAYQPTFSAITVAFWAKGSLSGQQRVMAAGGAGTSGFNIGADGFYIESGGTKYQGFASYFPDTNWHFYVLTWDGSTVAGYLDATLNQSSLSSPPGSITCGNSLTIGAYAPGGDFFPGDIAQVAIFPTALTAAQVQNLYLTAGYALSFGLADSPGSPSDTMGRLLSLPRSWTDALSAPTETLGRVAAFVRSVADSPASPGDTLTRQASHSRSASDSPGAPSDALARAVELPRTATDSPGVPSDTLTRGPLAFVRSVTDALSSPSETLSRMLAFLRSASDSPGSPSDALTRSSAHPRTASDSPGPPSDTVARGQLSLTRTASDSLPAPSETLARLVVFVRAVGDTLGGIVEILTLTTVGRAVLSIADSLSSPGETLARALSLARSVTDALSAPSEALGRIVGLARSAADSLPIPAETLARLLAFVRAIADSPPSPSESLSRTVNIPRSASDPVSTPTETLSRDLGLTRSVTDAPPAPTDTLTRRLGAMLALADSLPSPSEALTRIVGFVRGWIDAVQGIVERLLAGQVSPPQYMAVSFVSADGVWSAGAVGGSAIFASADGRWSASAADGFLSATSPDGTWKGVSA